MSGVCMRLWLAACLSIVSLLSLCEFTEAQGPAPVKLEDIIQAGQRRQDSVKSLHFTWMQRVTDAKGSRTLPRALDSSGDVVPPRDITYNMRWELWIDGEKMRSADDNYQWSKDKQALISCPHVATFDGKLLKRLNEKGQPTKPWPFASIEAKQKHPDVASIHLIPLLMTFRAANAKMRLFDIGQMTLTGRQARIQGHLCSELRLQHPAGTQMDQLWVDPSRDFVIPRYIETANGKMVYQIDVHFTADDRAGWTPSSWDMIWQFPDGRLRKSVGSKVVAHEINPSIPTDRFDIVIPLGARVKDFVTGRNYIIKTDGVERPIQKKELKLSYQELVSSEPGELVGEEPTFFSRWWIWLLGIGLSGLILVFFRYRRLGLRRAGPSQVG